MKFCLQANDGPGDAGPAKNIYSPISCFSLLVADSRCNIDQYGLPSFITSYNAKPVYTGTLIRWGSCLLPRLYWRALLPLGLRIISRWISTFTKSITEPRKHLKSSSQGPRGVYTSSTLPDLTSVGSNRCWLISHFASTVGKPIPPVHYCWVVDREDSELPRLCWDWRPCGWEILKIHKWDREIDAQLDATRFEGGKISFFC